MKHSASSQKTAKKLDQVWKFFAPITLLCLVLDQLSKNWANTQLTLGERVDFGFNLSHNSGLVFGFHMPLWGTYFLTLGILMLGFYVVVQNCLWKHKSHLLPLAFIFAGAIGNLIDRVHYGYVIDFIQVYWWPTFNLADVFIVMGVAILAWQTLISEEALEEL
ncbi:signal peptidase II [Candidatus Peregrinibacteria bacterium]|nr:MAG: signal peptidase II [Candidatus Peregrinibacteria bacterium]